MKTTKEQRAHIRHGLEGLKSNEADVYNAQVYALLDDLDEAEARAERAERETQDAIDERRRDHVSHVTGLAALRAELDSYKREWESACERDRAANARAERLNAALTKIDAIRNSIVGRQSINWSMHIYPLVAALDEAGFGGEGYDVARPKAAAEVKRMVEECEAPLRAELARKDAALREIASGQKSKSGLQVLAQNALAPAAPSASERKTSEETAATDGNVAPSLAASTSRPAEAPTEPGASNDYHCVHCGAYFPKQPRCPRCGV